MSELWFSIGIFTLFHVLPSTPLRGSVIKRIGRPFFMAIYSIISLALFYWLFVAFWRAEFDGAFFVTTPFVRYVSAFIMLTAFWLFAGALIRKQPVLLTAEPVLADPGAIEGILRITRHPFLWALVLWSALHMLNNADAAGLSLFGYFFLLALLGTWPIDRRRSRLIDDHVWQNVLAKTSNTPFAAILLGRQSPVSAIKEMGWAPPVLAIGAWALVLHFHESFFGLPVFY